MTEDEFYAYEEARGDLAMRPETMKCYLCLPIERRMKEDGPERKVVSLQVVNSADPTEAYTLECGHTII
jgi:hypothetical protein